MSPFRKLDPSKNLSGVVVTLPLGEFSIGGAAEIRFSDYIRLVTCKVKAEPCDQTSDQKSKPGGGCSKGIEADAMTQCFSSLQVTGPES
ncbi:hypothetical protein GDO81_018112 [Engystomops pustulosus]|uniref:Uncharacterized protein n=1 Tax=Engystomops pustulosus TaxID=76066 RepID=A0AAV7ABV0_ENGPU|nr:hypothetical protein GDO81_018112 [Engystomops pustulosus]